MTGVWESVAHVLFALALVTEVFVMGQEVLCSARAGHTEGMEQRCLGNPGQAACQGELIGQVQEHQTFSPDSLQYFLI